MSNKFVICTFYTPSYKRFLRQWTDSVKQWGYPYVAREMPEKGNWILNDMQKASVIRDVLNDYPGYNVLWCDIDGKIIKNPKVIASLDNKEYDFAGRPCGLKNGWSKFKDKLWSGNCILGAVLWFANNEVSKTFVNLWIESCANSPHHRTADQYNLNMTLGAHTEKIGLRIFKLPFEYCFCYHHMNKPQHEETKHNLKDAVIVQNIASRETRRRNKMQRKVRRRKPRVKGPAEHILPFAGHHDIIKSLKRKR